MEDLGDPRIVVAIAIYWFISGYMALALTPLAFEAGLVAMIIGLVLHLWARTIEDRGGHIPYALGGILLGFPMTLMFAGAVGLVMKWLGLLGQD